MIQQWLLILYTLQIYVSIIFIIRLHYSATYINAAYCYRPSSVVCVTVGQSVCHTSEPCKNDLTKRDAVWVKDLDMYLRDPDSPWEAEILRGGKDRL